MMEIYQCEECNKRFATFNWDEPEVCPFCEDAGIKKIGEIENFHYNIPDENK